MNAAPDFKILNHAVQYNKINTRNILMDCSEQIMWKTRNSVGEQGLRLVI